MDTVDDTVVLLSEDGTQFPVPRSAFRRIGAFRSAAEDPEVQQFPVPAVTANILKLVVEYLLLHLSDDSEDPTSKSSESQEDEKNAVDYDAEGEEDEENEDGDAALNDYSARLDLDEPDQYTRYSDLVAPQDRAFLEKLDLPTLLELTKAANYLFVPALLDLCCRGVAGHMRGLSVEQLRAKFNIVNDFTPEEEERVKRENMWAYE